MGLNLTELMYIIVGGLVLWIISGFITKMLFRKTKNHFMKRGDNKKDMDG